eukprot:6782978-Prymnesium_polylepis.1
MAQEMHRHIGWCWVCDEKTVTGHHGQWSAHFIHDYRDVVRCVFAPTTDTNRTHSAMPMDSPCGAWAWHRACLWVP